MAEIWIWPRGLKLFPNWAAQGKSDTENTYIPLSMILFEQKQDSMLILLDKSATGRRGDRSLMVVSFWSHCHHNYGSQVNLAAALMMDNILLSIFLTNNHFDFVLDWKFFLGGSAV